MIKNKRWVWGSIGLAVILALSVYLIPTEFIKAYINSIFSNASAAEKNYVNGFLNAAFLLKIRCLLIGGIALALLGINVLVSKYKDIGIEFRTIFSLLKRKLAEFGHPQFTVFSLLYLLAGLIAIPYIQINSDEAYAFEYFTQKNPLVSLVTYPAPNNHVLFSFLSSVLNKLIPFDLYSLRLPALLAAYFSSSLLLLFAKSRWKFKATAVAFVAVLLSFLPLFYAVQGRGYALLMLFASLSAILTIKAIESRKLEFPMTLVLVSTLGFYTIPIYLYPFAITLLIFTLYLPLKTIFKIGSSVSVLTLLLYAPIILLFGPEVLVANEFVQSASLPTIFERYPTHLLSFTKFFLPAVFLATYLLLRKKIQIERPVYFVFSSLLIGTLFIPLIHGTFPPMRVFIYTIPFAFLAMAAMLKEDRHLQYLIIPVLIFSILTIKREYLIFNKYSIEAKLILEKAIEKGAKKIYLLDGPRSIFKWYLKEEDPKLEFVYSLNRDDLNRELLSDPSYHFISEYRWQEVSNYSFQLLDTTSYFRLLKRKDKPIE